jgi:membrane protein
LFIDLIGEATMTAAAHGAIRQRPDFRRHWTRILVHTFRAFTDPDTSFRCAGTAFFGFLSLFPAIATIVLVYGLVSDRTGLIVTLDSVEGFIPDAALNVIRGQLDTLVTQPPTALGIGLLISIPLALWSGSRGIDALIYAMSRVRSDTQRRGFIKTVLVAVGLTIVGSIFLVIALGTVAGLPALTSLLPFPSREEWLVLAIRWPILLMLSTVLVALLYRWGPDRHPRKFRYIWPGAVFSSLLWVLAGLVFSIYVENFGNFEASFGSVTAAVVLLLWFYNSAQIFVLGAALNTQIEYEDRAEAGDPVGPEGEKPPEP